MADKDSHREQNERVMTEQETHEALDQLIASFEYINGLLDQMEEVYHNIRALNESI